MANKFDLIFIKRILLKYHTVRPNSTLLHTATVNDIATCSPSQIWIYFFRAYLSCAVSASVLRFLIYSLHSPMTDGTVLCFVYLGETSLLCHHDSNNSTIKHAFTIRYDTIYLRALKS